MASQKGDGGRGEGRVEGDEGTDFGLYGASVAARSCGELHHHYVRI